MNERIGETTFAAVTAVLVLVAAASPVVMGQGSAAEDESVAFDPGVPAEYDFSPPQADGTATIDGDSYDTLDAALAAAEPGDEIRLRGQFDGPVRVDTPHVTLVGDDGYGLIDGDGDGTVVNVTAKNVTLDRVWVRNSGYEASKNDAGVWIAGANATIVDARVTEITFGIWIDGVTDVQIRNSTIVGREEVTPLTQRGNGIQLWKADDAIVTNTTITDVRDGMYFSWATAVRAHDNTMWDLRYGVHYMYSDDCVLTNNTAFGNDIGFALMLSDDLVLRHNRAIDNHGSSGHGIMVKSVDHTELLANDVVGNRKGFYVYNSQDNTIADNVVMENDDGVHLTAGSDDERVHGNTFIDNDNAVRAVLASQVAWNDSEHGNYWAGVQTTDVNDDGVSELRYRPAGLVERLHNEHPTLAVFTNSPAFRIVKRAERSLPIVDSPGVVDHHPLVDPPTDRWRAYYDTDHAT
jgi:nitrous oxidase accessory protein